MTVSPVREQFSLLFCLVLSVVFSLLTLALCCPVLSSDQDVSSPEGSLNITRGAHGNRYLVGLEGTPSEVMIPWLVVPGHPDAPGVAVVDVDALRSLEASCTKAQLLAPYDDTRHYYLVHRPQAESEREIYEAGDVLWQSGQSYLVSVKDLARAKFALSRLRARRLEPSEAGLSSLGGGLPSSIPLPVHSAWERFWMERMVNAVSEENLREHICALSGETLVNLSSGPHRIMTRYSYHPDCRRAAEYLYSEFERMGLDVAYEDYLGIPIRCIEFMGLEGFAVGDSGRIYHTQDGGDSWESQISGTSDDLWGSCFVSPDTFWAAVEGGGGRLLGTADGGLNWIIVNTGVRHPLYDVEFVDAQVGWACGSAGIVLKTSDGGASWVTQTTGQAFRLYDIEFLDPLHGWSVGYSGYYSAYGDLLGKILHTSDGGRTWKTQASVMDTRFYDACFVDTLRGWVVGQNGTILGTSDGGVSWQPQNSRVTEHLYGVCFVDSLRGWAVGGGGLVLFTANAGRSWNIRRTSMGGMGSSLYSVSFINGTQGWVVGRTSLLRTVDGGITWSSLNEGVPDAWRNVVATLEGTASPSTVYVVCGHYDSISRIPMIKAPGADDNASGTSLVLEAARVLKDYGFESTIKFVFFSGEELGPYGSSYYTECALHRGERIEAALNFDMIAYGTPSAYLVGNGASYQLVNYCHAVGDSFVPQLPLVDVINNSWVFSDHASFWQKGYRALCGIELDNEINPYWHTAHDIVDYLDMNFAADVTRLAVASLASLAGLSEAPPILASVNVLPNTLNLQSRGRYVTCRIELPRGLPVTDIDVPTVRLNGSVSAEADSCSLGDHDSNGRVDVVVKFDRERVQEVLPKGDAVEVAVTGEAGGLPFEGRDTIRVIGEDDYGREEPGTVSVEDQTVRKYELSKNYPDPFNPSTLIRYELPLPCEVSLQVFDVRGKLVKTLIDDWRPQGGHVAVWDGKNQAGVAVPSGVYFYRLRAADFTCVRKMVVLR
ncbi:MAG: M20/M25/M40 family metallo-hydrolase [Candidatus Eiseniibacteriota bacterium]|nr:MAG: M20/M25/M40 family metallo-hydrolase [Candidatus Eisenbacteria bacterium]